MQETQKSLVKKGCTLAIVMFIIKCIISKPSGLYNIWGVVGEAVTITLAIVIFYEKWGWKVNCFEKIPHIWGDYEAKLDYEYEGKRKSKTIQIKIKQSLTKTSVEIVTNEISSQSITSSLVTENGQKVLYYTYITSPKSRYSSDNPIQHGTCRLIIRKGSLPEGTYWTSRKTIGDITFKNKLQMT